MVQVHVVGYKKITKDEASDADLANAEVTFQPQTRTSRPLSDAEVAFQSQTRRSRSNLRRGSRVLCQTRRSHSNFRREGRQMRTSRPLSDAEVARRGPHVLMPDAKVARRGPCLLCQTRRSSDVDLTFQLSYIPFSLHIMGNNFPLWRDLRSWLHTSHYGEI